jgi:hypothetical protein
MAVTGAVDLAQCNGQQLFDTSGLSLTAIVSRALDIWEDQVCLKYLSEWRQRMGKPESEQIRDRPLTVYDAVYMACLEATGTTPEATHFGPLALKGIWPAAEKLVTEIIGGTTEVVKQIQKEEHVAIPPERREQILAGL